jgi:head-tail adaptor
MPGLGQYRHVVYLENPGDPQPDGDGGYIETFAPLDPADWDCAILSAAAARASGRLEALAAGTVLAQATHVISGPYHPGITIETRLTFEGRRLNVIAVDNRDERNIDTICVCAEVLS